MQRTGRAESVFVFVGELWAISKRNKFLETPDGPDVGDDDNDDEFKWKIAMGNFPTERID